MLEVLCPDSTGDLRKRFLWIATTAMATKAMMATMAIVATMAILADYINKKLPNLILPDPLKRGSISIAEYAYVAVECVARICSIMTSLS